MYLVRLQPWVEVVKTSCGWQRAKRSGIHDQMSRISLALTISEENVSGFSASCTFRLETSTTTDTGRERGTECEAGHVVGGAYTWKQKEVLYGGNTRWIWRIAEKKTHRKLRKDQRSKHRSDVQMKQKMVDAADTRGRRHENIV